MKARHAAMAMAFALAATGVLTATISAQAATKAPPKPNETLVVIYPTFGQATAGISGSGPISGLGQAGPSDLNPGNPNDFRFGFGTSIVWVDTHITSHTFNFNKAACISHSNYAGTWKIVNSAGGYSGATGQGTFKQVNVQLGCSNTPPTSPLFTSVATITYTGTVTIPKQPV